MWILYAISVIRGGLTCFNSSVDGMGCCCLPGVEGGHVSRWCWKKVGLLYPFVESCEAPCTCLFFQVVPHTSTAGLLALQSFLGA